MNSSAMRRAFVCGPCCLLEHSEWKTYIVVLSVCHSARDMTKLYLGKIRMNPSPLVLALSLIGCASTASRSTPWEYRATASAGYERGSAEGDRPAGQASGGAAIRKGDDTTNDLRADRHPFFAHSYSGMR